jgi:putative lipoprotein
MRVARSLVVVALLPLFAACQLFDGQRESASHVGQTRMQGQLTAADGKLVFQPCQDQRQLVINDIGGTSILQEAATLADDHAANRRSELKLEPLRIHARTGSPCATGSAGL